MIAVVNVNRGITAYNIEKMNLYEFNINGDETNQSTVIMLSQTPEDLKRWLWIREH